MKMHSAPPAHGPCKQQRLPTGRSLFPWPGWELPGEPRDLSHPVLSLAEEERKIHRQKGRKLQNDNIKSQQPKGMRKDEEDELCFLSVRDHAAPGRPEPHWHLTCVLAGAKEAAQQQPRLPRSRGALPRSARGGSPGQHRGRAAGTARLPAPSRRPHTCATPRRRAARPALHRRLGRALLPLT